MKILLELEIPGLEDEVSRRVKERQWSLDQLVAEIPVSRETGRRVVVGRERLSLHAVLLVCDQLGIEPQKVKSLVCDAINREDFEAIVKKYKVVKNLPKKSKLEKAIKSRKSNQIDP